MSIIIFIISLAVLIFVHECGHFLVAKWAGIRVEEFGLGFPPKVWSKKVGETTYTINVIPFGGFVKIFGEDPHSEHIEEKDKHRSMYYKPKWVQACVLVAGVTFNILFAWFLVSFGFMVGLPSPVNHTGVGTVTNPHVLVTEVIRGSPAEKANLFPGDMILFVSAGNDSLQDKTLTPEAISHLVATSHSKYVEILYRRGASLPTTAFIIPMYDSTLGRRAIGIGTDTVGTLKLSFFEAVIEGAHTTWLLTQNTAVGLGYFLWAIVTFKADFSEVSGPVGIAGVIGHAKNLGFMNLLSLIAIISVNLAVLNLIPFPALDGGRLFLILLEVIFRRPIPPRVVRWINAIGFGLLLILMLVITIHDIRRLIFV